MLSNAQIPKNIQAWEAVLRDRGCSVGWNLQIEYRYFQGRTEQIPTLLAELLTFGPEVIVTSTSDSAAAIHTAAPTIPLVFLSVADPIGLGLVESLAHPGGNVTGLSRPGRLPDPVRRALIVTKGETKFRAPAARRARVVPLFGDRRLRTDA